MFIGRRGVALVHPRTPARTRFAPSPTGVLHLGSLRTALYNYLLAKSTGGAFVVRLEDTDQKRLVPGAEANIYETLRWCGLQMDEGPPKGGAFGPYRQSERRHIYQKYVEELLRLGAAYKCYCSKERLEGLRESARRLKPPTTMTYDRWCEPGSRAKRAQRAQRLGAPQGGAEPEPVAAETAAAAAAQSEPVAAAPRSDAHSGPATAASRQPAATSTTATAAPFVIRFKAPAVYPPFSDLCHGTLDLQPQANPADRRYDDFVIMKSDGLPTYHFASVIDDHLMGITHVVRGEEWLSATPKHVALYAAFGWQPPHFCHIPLLTSKDDRKLSKRAGAGGVLLLRDTVLPEALLNFVALFGWLPPRAARVSTSEVMTLAQMAARFSLNHLTRGNAKVSSEKLHYFNRMHLQRRLADPLQRAAVVERVLQRFPAASPPHVERCLQAIAPALTAVGDWEAYGYLFDKVEFAAEPAMRPVLAAVAQQLGALDAEALRQMAQRTGYTQREVFQALRRALAGGRSGLTVPVLVGLLGREETLRRVQAAQADGAAGAAGAAGEANAESGGVAKC